MKPFNVILTMCANRGISYQGIVPWTLNAERKHFARMTKKRVDDVKRNVVIMGRNTFVTMPDIKRGPVESHMFRHWDIPLGFPMRYNAVLTSKPKDRRKFPSDTKLYAGLEEALTALEEPPLDERIETAWIVGGVSVFEQALKSPLCQRIYITEILEHFECDKFLPEIDEDEFKLVSNNDGIPECIQVEDGVRFRFLIYERVKSAEYAEAAAPVRFDSCVAHV
jgi:dihydrofolate reductase